MNLFGKASPTVFVLTKTLTLDKLQLTKTPT